MLKNILYITPVLLCRLMFVFIDDPEGPNLLIVVLGALVIYFTSKIIFSFLFSKMENNNRKILLSLLIQVVVVFIFFLFLR
jgi:hypothetical protein